METTRRTAALAVIFVVIQPWLACLAYSQLNRDAFMIVATAVTLGMCYFIFDLFSKLRTETEQKIRAVKNSASVFDYANLALKAVQIFTPTASRPLTSIVTDLDSHLRRQTAAATTTPPAPTGVATGTAGARGVAGAKEKSCSCGSCHNS